MRAAVRNVPPSELSTWDPPKGWSVIWKADARCRPTTPGEHDNRLCRRPGCHGKPVMALQRSNGWWLYCAEHLYGRRIVNGVVEQRILRDERESS